MCVCGCYFIQRVIFEDDLEHGKSLCVVGDSANITPSSTFEFSLSDIVNAGVVVPVRTDFLRNMYTMIMHEFCKK